MLHASVLLFVWLCVLCVIVCLRVCMFLSVYVLVICGIVGFWDRCLGAFVYRCVCAFACLRVRVLARACVFACLRVCGLCSSYEQISISHMYVSHVWYIRLCMVCIKVFKMDLAEVG